MNDLRFAICQLLKHPGFTAVAVLTLALGIGANTAIFSVLERVLLHPLHCREPDRLVTVCESNLKRGYWQVIASIGNILDWRAQNNVFEDIAAEVYASFNLTGIERPEHLQAACVTANYFSVLGVPPLLGRTFLMGEDQPGHDVAVLGHALWQSSFGADAKVIGRSVALNGRSYTVVGVMSANFQSFNLRTVFGRPTGDAQPQLWVPYAITPEERAAREAKYFLALARLKRGVTVAQAQHEMNAIAVRLAEQFPTQKDWGVHVRPLQEQIVGPLRPALLTLVGVVAFLLLFACANVANLLLARAGTRKGEFAIRAALGASRWQIVRQLLMESLLLALLSGALGVMLAQKLMLWHGMGLALVGIGVGLAGSLGLARLLATQLFGITPTDPATFALVSLVLLLVTMAACYLPARRAMKVDPIQALRTE